ncbi:hypothetical protein MUK70_13200 [Dyadobacter chenwenxiniae]|uniref:DUF4595 domain-containing protein n=1 Tax=Dyadobacter chenwenxiniae TaxID=2906456 RepID=A0A9X1PF68_9BACT|nr:hypothetical protein [Dyadobacter chenwenxiniae]MCF0060202.1 hypothetical protein [Dyadobacter chenwenxiniae]UON85939.1 hypothetical protein MUK70_13200 [Dyadobacter chenwenxiniae]
MITSRWVNQNSVSSFSQKFTALLSPYCDIFYENSNVIMTKKPSPFRISAQMFLLISIAIFSCGKNELSPQKASSAFTEGNSNAFVVSQVLLQTTMPGSDITDIQYNADHSLKGYRTEGGTYTISVTYAPNKVIYTTVYGGNKSSDIVYDLVNQYAVKKLETFYTSGGNLSDVIQTDYVYEAGKVAKEYYRENNLPDGYLAYYYDNHNVTFQERYDADGLIVNKVSYEYYLKHADKSTVFSQFNFKTDAKLFPQKSQNLVETKYLKKPGKNPVSTHYTYILNGSGYPTSGTVSGSASYNWTSIWQ